MKVEVKLLADSYERQSKTGRKYNAAQGIIEDPDSRWKTIRVFVTSDVPFKGNRTVKATLVSYDSFKGDASVRLEP